MASSPRRASASTPRQSSRTSATPPPRSRNWAARASCGSASGAEKGEKDDEEKRRRVPRMPRMTLRGASAIITGGASGIGEQCARQISALGARVVIADRREEAGKAVADEIGGLFVPCDVASEEDGAAVV